MIEKIRKLQGKYVRLYISPSRTIEGRVDYRRIRLVLNTHCAKFGGRKS